MATNLASYYTGQNQALPSLAARSSAFSNAGLGSGYTGTAQQNQSLLNYLQGSSTTGSSTPPGTSTSMGTSGGYSQTPSVQPQPTTSDPGLTDLNDFTSQQAAARTALVNQLNSAATDPATGLYAQAAGQSGLANAQSNLTLIQNALNSSQNQSAAVPVNENQNSVGSSTDQTNGRISTDQIPLNEQIAQLSANLVPAENTFNNASNQTQSILGVLQNAQGQQLTNFDQNNANELAALQAKVQRGEALTDEEFARETQLQAAQVGANATTGAAGIAANASTSNNTANNTLSAWIAALQNPGINVTYDSNGKPVGNSFLNSPVQGTAVPSSGSGSGSASNFNNLTNTNAAKTYIGPTGSQPNAFGLTPNGNGTSKDSQGNTVDAQGFLIDPKTGKRRIDE